MKTLIAAIVMLIFPATAPAFENPDGRPGSFAVEPFFQISKQSRADVSDLTFDRAPQSDFRSKQWGASIIVPMSTRVTFRGRFHVGHSTETPPEFVDVTFEDRHSIWSYRVSMRFWMGGPK